MGYQEHKKYKDCRFLGLLGLLGRLQSRATVSSLGIGHSLLGTSIVLIDTLYASPDLYWDMKERELGVLEVRGSNIGHMRSSGR